MRDSERKRDRVDDKQISQPQFEFQAMIRTTSRAKPRKNASENETDTQEERWIDALF